MMAIHSALRVKVLRFFFTNPAVRVYVNDLARRIDADPKNLHRLLVRLELEGVLLSEFQGNQRYFFSNTKTAAYRAYRTLFMRSYGVEDVIGSALKDLPGVKKAYIFGSYANGKFTGTSDVDVLVVGRHRVLAVEKCLKKISRDLGREINAVHITEEELAKKKAAKDTFISTVFSGKILPVC